MKSFDLNTGSINLAIVVMRQAAQDYRESAAELQSAWQDDSAGKIWVTAASGLDKLADKLQREWERM